MRVPWREIWRQCLGQRCFGEAGVFFRLCGAPLAANRLEGCLIRNNRNTVNGYCFISAAMELPKAYWSEDVWKRLFADFESEEKPSGRG